MNMKHLFYFQRIVRLYLYILVIAYADQDLYR